MSLVLNFVKDSQIFSEEFKFEQTLDDIYSQVAPETDIYRKVLYFNGENLGRNSTQIRETELVDQSEINIGSFYTTEQIKDHLKWINKVKRNGNALKHVNNQTDEICLEAVRQNGYALARVHNQTDEICLEAVRQNGYALQCVHNQTEEICLEAVRQNGYALKFVENQTEEICLEAVRQNSVALMHVEYQTAEICLAVPRQSINALRYVEQRFKYLFE